VKPATSNFLNIIIVNTDNSDKELKLCETVSHIFGDKVFLVEFINANMKHCVCFKASVKYSSHYAISITLHK